jgi:mxaK protein
MGLKPAARGVAWGRVVRRVAVAGVIVLAAAAAWDVRHLVQARALNAALDRTPLPAEAPGEATTAAPALRLARAMEAAERGPLDAALPRYAALYADPQLGLTARYNAANLLLRQGMALRERNQPGQALALIELAKEGFREVLRKQPDHWPARHNLERAQRLVPDPDDLEEAPADGRQDAERAATTMRGYSPGMP